MSKPFFTASDFEKLRLTLSEHLSEIMTPESVYRDEIFDLISDIKRASMDLANAKLEREGKVVYGGDTNLVDGPCQVNRWFEALPFKFQKDCTHKALVIQQEPLEASERGEE